MMRSYAPKTLAELPASLAALTPESKIVGGGTDFVIRLHSGAVKPDALCYLGHIPELKMIEKQGDTISVGAYCTMTQMEHDPIVREYLPALMDAAADVGSLQIRNNGTIGGNLCNGAVSADTCAPVLALNGYLNIRGAEGERTIPALGFHTGPGRVALKRDEVLLSVEFRPEDWQGWGAAYHKYAMREAMDIATIGCAAAVRLDGTVISGIRLAYSVSAPIPVRCPSAEAAALGRSATPEALPATLAAISAAVEADVQPRTSWRANRDFRMHIIRTLAERVIARCVVRAVELQEAASC